MNHCNMKSLASRVNILETETIVCLCNCILFLLFFVLYCSVGNKLHSVISNVQYTYIICVLLA